MAQLPPKVNIIPIRDVVILPTARVSFRVGREMSIHALQDALKSDKRIALFPQLDGENVTPNISDLYQVGVLAEIESHVEEPAGQVKIVVKGLVRVQISKLISSSPCFIIEPIEATDTRSRGKVSLPPIKDIKEAASLLLKYKPEIWLASHIETIPYNDEPGRLADYLIARSTSNFDSQIACLLELDSRKRLKLAYEILVKEVQQAQLESEINEQVTMAIKEEHRQIFLQGQLKIILEELGENTPLSLHTSIFKGKNFKVDPNLLFVLMPFAEEFHPIFKEIIKPVAEQFGLTCIRADDLYGPKAIIEDIWKLINEAKIVIADVTGKNPNVFYEIGLAHAIGKDVIIISQSIEDVPFDLRHLRCLIYKDSVAGFRKLETQLHKALSTSYGLKELGPAS